MPIEQENIFLNLKILFGICKMYFIYFYKSIFIFIFIFIKKYLFFIFIFLSIIIMHHNIVIRFRIS